MIHPKVHSKMSKELAGCVDFLKKEKVVGLAVGVIVGGAATKLVTSLVTNIITPLIGLVAGAKGAFGGISIGPVMIGAFLNSLIDFIVIMAVVYFIINKDVNLLMPETSEQK